VAGGLSPRVVVAVRPTEWDQLLARHATPGQARFFLESRERDVAAVIDRHRAQEAAVTAVERTIPTAWRRTQLRRADFPAFLFTPEDIVVAVGQDGLVPNLAKYLDGQPVIGINPDPGRYEGALVRFPVAAAGDALAGARSGRAPVEERTMVEVRIDDGRRSIALNEVFIGHRSHQSARYVLQAGDITERQSSSGLIVATGTGATGWARSIATERETALPLPAPTDRRLVFFVREAWPSVASGTDLTEGWLDGQARLTVVSEMEHGGVAFGDGIEDDRLPVGWGQEVTVGIAAGVLRLVVP